MEENVIIFSIIIQAIMAFIAGICFKRSAKKGEAVIFANFLAFASCLFMVFYFSLNYYDIIQQPLNVELASLEVCQRFFTIPFFIMLLFNSQPYGSK